MDVKEIKDSFLRAFGGSAEPQVARAPGRINLIGEHIDYNGLPVLPMTLDRAIRVAFRPREDARVRLVAADPELADAEFANGPALEPSPPGSWDNYCKAAFQGLNDHFQPASFPGMDAYVWGDIPPAAGLSSSSALVVACSLACLAALGKRLGEDLSRMDLATLLARAEQYVGTQGGGMDQAIILLGDEGAACKLDFFPLRCERVPLFDGHVFVACNSLVKAVKTGEALHKYNEGPLSCRLIRALVERQAQREFGDDLELTRLADLWYGSLCLTDAEVEQLFADTFTAERMNLGDIAHALELEPDEVRQRWLGELPEPPGGFALKARARHQLTEYQRVEKARDLTLLGDAAGFGELMNASHASCASDYKVSCPELEKLVTAAREAGSLGSRLTGAGFGGCTVNLVREEELDTFIETVNQGYYRDYLGDEPRGMEPRPVLPVSPAKGADYEA